MFYGFVITEAGNQLLAKMVAGQTLKLSGVFMDLRTVEDKETARQLTAPLEPGPAGTSTVPTVKGNQVGMIVQFRSDLDGGLKEDKWIGGFGVYAEDPDTGDPVMIYYASLGHQRQPIAAYVEGTAPDVRNFPISIRVTSGVDATLTYPAGAWMTAEDVLLYFNETIKPELEAALAGLIEAQGAVRTGSLCHVRVCAISQREMQAGCQAGSKHVGMPEAGGYFPVFQEKGRAKWQRISTQGGSA